MRKGLTWLLILCLALLPVCACAEAVLTAPQMTLLYRSQDASDIQARAWGGMLAITLGGEANILLLPGSVEAAPFGKDIEATIYDATKLSIHLSGHAGAAIVNASVETTTIMDTALLCVLGHSTIGQADALGDATLLITGETLLAREDDWTRTSLIGLFEMANVSEWMTATYVFSDAADYEIPSAPSQTAGADHEEEAAVEAAATPETEDVLSVDEAQMAERLASEAVLAASRIYTLSLRNAARVLLYGAVDARAITLRNQSSLVADAAGADTALVIFSVSMQHTADASVFDACMEKVTIGGTASIAILAQTQLQRLFVMDQASASIGPDALIATIFHRDSASIYGMPEDQRVIMQFHTN